MKLINTSLGKGEDDLPFIGVLDIFGERQDSLMTNLTKFDDSLIPPSYHKYRTTAAAA